jgi:hypothetical protein
MPAPSAEAIRQAVVQHVQSWNEGNKERWLSGWAEAAPGGLRSFEDPVGTPAKSGWEVLDKAWDESPAADWNLTLKSLYVCGNEAAAFLLNKGKVQGEPTELESIEIYSFDEDGGVSVKTYWDVPEGSEYGAWVSQ